MGTWGLAGLYLARLVRGGVSIEGSVTAVTRELQEWKVFMWTSVHLFVLDVVVAEYLCI